MLKMKDKKDHPQNLMIKKLILGVNLQIYYTLKFQNGELFF